MRRFEHAEDHRDAALASERGEVRSRAAELGDDTGGIELVVVDVIVRIDDAHNYFCACPVIGTKRTGNSDSVCISSSRFVSRSSS